MNLETYEHTSVSNLRMMHDISVMGIRFATGLK